MILMQDKVWDLAQGIVISSIGCIRGHGYYSGLNSVPSNSGPPWASECDLIWKRSFADNQLSMLRSNCSGFRVIPKPEWLVSFYDKRDTEKNASWESKAEIGTTHCKPHNAKDCQPPEAIERHRFCPRAFRGSKALSVIWFQISGPQNCEWINFSYFKDQLCSSWLWQP